MAGAFNWNGPTPMGLASYVQQQGDFGRQRGEDSRLARLVSGAMADPSKRQANVAEIASFRPDAAFAAQGQFDQQQDRKYAELGKRAEVLVGAPQAMQAQVWAQMRPELEQMGLTGLPEQVTPEILQTAQQLARTYGGASGGGAGMFSQKVGADGYIYNTDRQGNITNTGVKADRQMWFANNEGVDPYLTDKDGNVRMVGGGPAPQSAPTQPPVPQPTNSGGDPKADAITAAANAMIKAGVPEAQVDAFIQQSMSAAGLNPQPAPADAGAMLPTSGGSGAPAPSGAPVAPPAPAQGDISRVPINDLGGGPINPLRRPGAKPPGSAPPSGYRFRADGGLEFIPGGPADPANKPQAQDKPIPVGALRLQLEAEEALTGAEGVIDELDRIDQQLKSGALDLGFFSNLANKAKNFAGMSDEESRAYGAFTSTLERLRNESLRLNKGVQTEGDSQRAWNELIADINDGKNVQTQIERIQRYNRRAVELQQRKMQAVQHNYQGKAAADNPEDDIDALLAEFGN